MGHKQSSMNIAAIANPQERLLEPEMSLPQSYILPVLK